MRGKYLVCVGVLMFLLRTGLLWAHDAQNQRQAPLPQEPPAPSLGQAPNIPHSYNITPEDRTRKNPTKFNEVTVTRGKRIYLTQCAMCHGIKGDGKGDLAQEMKISPPDFSKTDTLKKRTDGELFKIIGVGNDSMPGQEKRMTDTQRWNLINYLRAVGGSVPEKATGKEPEENIIEVPQDQAR